MGPQINSKYNELHLTIIDTQVFFSSNRPGDQGYTTYIRRRLPLKKAGLKSLFAIKTKKPLSVEMNVSTKIKESDEKTVTYEIKKKTDDTGEAVVQLARKQRMPMSQSCTGNTSCNGKDRNRETPEHAIHNRARAH